MRKFDRLVETVALDGLLTLKKQGHKSAVIHVRNGVVSVEHAPAEAPAAARIMPQHEPLDPSNLAHFVGARQADHGAKAIP